MGLLTGGSFEELRAQDGPTLQSQQIIQHGAIHALEHLLVVGPTKEHVMSMLVDLHTALGMVERIAAAKGVELTIDHAP